MIYSTLYNKNTNEDPRTSIVFENLMLLPDRVLWNVLKKAASNKDILPDDAGLLYDNFSFWPKWSSNSKYDTGNSDYVEPDVFFRFENIDVIVEAKYSDHTGQYRDEWDREFKAYLNEFENEGKRVVLLAVGGNLTFEREPDLKIDRHKCSVVKYSWANILNALLEYEKEFLSNANDEVQSSMKRLIRNLEFGFQNIGIHKYNKKVEIKGLSNLFLLGKVFQNAINRETDLYTLIYYKEDINSKHYGYQFEVRPKDRRKKSIWLSVAMWINEQEVISIEARNSDSWASKFCKQIEDGKKFSSKYAQMTDPEGSRYFFDAKEKFYQEFNDAATFDAQVAVVSKLIDDVCLYYFK